MPLKRGTPPPHDGNVPLYWAEPQPLPTPHPVSDDFFLNKFRPPMLMLAEITTEPITFPLAHACWIITNYSIHA